MINLIVAKSRGCERWVNKQKNLIKILLLVNIHRQAIQWSLLLICTHKRDHFYCCIRCWDEVGELYCFRVTFRVHSIQTITLFMTSKIFKSRKNKTEMDEHVISVDFLNVNALIVLSITKIYQMVHLILQLRIKKKICENLQSLNETLSKILHSPLNICRPCDFDMYYILYPI